MPLRIFHNAQVFTSAADTDRLSDGVLIVENDRIKKICSPEDDYLSSINGISEHIDVGGRVLMPAFIDGHTHLMEMGQSMQKLNLGRCKDLNAIKDAIRHFAAQNPNQPRIYCKYWMQSAVNGVPLASYIDDIDPRPIYIEAFDMHSIWCSSSALHELDIMDRSDPAGGKIYRDHDGKPSGLLTEEAFHSIVIPFLLNKMSFNDRVKACSRGISSYIKAGYAGIVDMAMNTSLWEVLLHIKESSGLPMHVAAFWIIPFNEDFTEIERSLSQAIEMNRKYNPKTNPDFCVVGIKIVSDGVVDGCTAALSLPYGGNTDPTEPIWPADVLSRVVQKADKVNLQCAIHAIGDRAVTQAIDAISTIKDRTSRHRIEHLELTTEEDAKRLGELGIIASVQPVHSDPALLKAWPSLIGEHRCKRAFAYKQFLDGGAPLAFGTDAPTAENLPLPNLYNATTRRSALDPESTDKTNERFAVAMADAVRAATLGAAYSRQAEKWTGSLQEGMSADFVVCNLVWDPEKLLSGNVCQTWYKGILRYDENKSIF